MTDDDYESITPGGLVETYRTRGNFLRPDPVIVRESVNNIQRAGRATDEYRMAVNTDTDALTELIYEAMTDAFDPADAGDSPSFRQTDDQVAETIAAVIGDGTSGPVADEIDEEVAETLVGVIYREKHEAERAGYDTDVLVLGVEQYAILEAWSQSKHDHSIDVRLSFEEIVTVPGPCVHVALPNRTMVHEHYEGDDA